jgi:hypothetical protein
MTKAVVTPANLSGMFDVGAQMPNKITLKAGPGIQFGPGFSDVRVDPALTAPPVVSETLSGTVKTLVIDGVTTTLDLAPAIASGQVVTTLAYSPATQTLSYTNEAGTTVSLDLSALSVDVFVNGGTYDPATMILTLTDNDATTAPITIDLASLKVVEKATTGDVTLSGDGTTISPLSASAKIDTAAAGNILTTSAAGLKAVLPPTTVSGSVGANALTVTVDGVSSAPINLPPPTPPVSSVSGSVSGNNLTVTVNGVSSAPINLPPPTAIANTLTNTVNTITSVVSGVPASAPAVNTVAGSVTGTDLTVTVNGVASAPIALPAPTTPTTTNALTNAANTITSTVNGVTATAPAVNTVAASVSGSSMTVTVNGVASAPVTLPPSATTHTMVSVGNVMTSNVNGVSATAAPVNSVSGSVAGSNLTVTVNGVASAPIALPAGATTHTMSSAGNTITSIVNGVTATAPAVNTNVLSVNGSGQLVSTINGVASAGVAVPAQSFWRSGIGGTILPDGTSDTTEAIRRNGNVGINVDPASTLDVAGSFATNIRGTILAPITGADTIQPTDHTIIYAAGATVTLPSATTFARRIIEVKKASTTGTVNFTGATVDGQPPTVLTLPNPWQSQTLQSDGQTWVRI